MAYTTNKAVLPQGVKTNVITLTNQKTDLTNSSSVVVAIPDTLMVNGARITKITAIPRGAVTSDTQIQCYRRYPQDSAKVNNYYLTDMVMLPSYTVSSITAPSKASFAYTPDNPMIVAPNEEISFAIGSSVAVGINVIVEFETY
jgi:hypothetical protein